MVLDWKCDLQCTSYSNQYKLNQNTMPHLATFFYSMRSFQSPTNISFQIHMCGYMNIVEIMFGLNEWQTASLTKNITILHSVTTILYSMLLLLYLMRRIAWWDTPPVVWNADGWTGCKLLLFVMYFTWMTESILCLR